MRPRERSQGAGAELPELRRGAYHPRLRAHAQRRLRELPLRPGRQRPQSPDPPASQGQGENRASHPARHTRQAARRRSTRSSVFRSGPSWSNGMPYSWREYLLFNPYKGFRYLTEYNGHWNYVTPLKSVPEVSPRAPSRSATYLGEKYRISRPPRLRRRTWWASSRGKCGWARGRGDGFRQSSAHAFRRDHGRGDHLVAG